jgi:Uma2 family endonuclease
LGRPFRFRLFTLPFCFPTLPFTLALFYVSAELEAKLDPARRASADLVIEVISPRSAIYDRNTKADTYGAPGVSELWLVDETGKTVEVRNRVGNGFGAGVVRRMGERVASAVFEDLVLPVDKIFLDSTRTKCVEGRGSCRRCC